MYFISSFYCTLLNINFILYFILHFNFNKLFFSAQNRPVSAHIKRNYNVMLKKVRVCDGGCQKQGLWGPDTAGMVQSSPREKKSNNYTVAAGFSGFWYLRTNVPFWLTIYCQCFWYTRCHVILRWLTSNVTPVQSRNSQYFAITLLVRPIWDQIGCMWAEMSVTPMI